MSIISKVFLAVVALEHFFIMMMEMFLWEKRGPTIFKSFEPDLFAKTKAMAKNMGIYNGFLAAGLTWSLFISDTIWSVNIAVFFLICVIVAGLYAAVTAERSVFIKQSIPALVTLLLVILT